jgi:6-phosphogluconate dehydrogenase
MNQQYDFGMIGIGVMGSNLLLNMADHGFKVIGFDTNPEKVDELNKEATEKRHVKAVNELTEFVNSLTTPRKMMMLVPAGPAVDAVINNLLPLLKEGDIVIDGGNSHYTDTLKRVKFLEEKKIHFMGAGISGGEQGARTGPSIMPGGDKEAYEAVAPLFTSVAAKVGNEVCVDYLGRDAAGHYVKMVHNGIEYGIMEIISECYDVMHHGLAMSNEEMSAAFASWNKEMNAFLLEITVEILKQKDDKSAGYLIDAISDKAGAKGTGKWTSQEGLDIPSPIPSIDMAVMVRNISSLKEQREKAAGIYKNQPSLLTGDKAALVNQLGSTLYSSIVITYAQGLALLTTASLRLDMQVPMDKVLKVWRGGCIIRSGLLDTFSAIYSKDPHLSNILLNSDIADKLSSHVKDLREITSLALSAGYPVAGLSATVSYFNAFTRQTLPTNMVQAQRDFFGAHTYQRTDMDGFFHTEWQNTSAPIV